MAIPLMLSSQLCVRHLTFAGINRPLQLCSLPRCSFFIDTGSEPTVYIYIYINNAKITVAQSIILELGDGTSSHVHGSVSIINSRL